MTKVMLDRYANRVTEASTKVNKESRSVYHVFQAHINLNQRKITARIVQLIPTPLKQSKRHVQTALLTTSTPNQAKRFVKNVKLEKKLVEASVDHYTACNANQVRRIQYQVVRARTAVLDRTTTPTILFVKVASLESGAMLKD